MVRGSNAREHVYRSAAARAFTAAKSNASKKKKKKTSKNTLTIIIATCLLTKLQAWY